MTRKLPVASSLALVLLVSPVLAQDGVAGVPFSLNSSVAEVKRALGLSNAPQPMPDHPPLSVGDSFLRERNAGIWAFFHQDGRVYLIRLDPPFAGSVGGIRLGEPRSALLEKLGAPKRKVKSPDQPLEAYLYDMPGFGARFDFDRAENINRMMVFPASGIAQAR